MVGLGGHAPPRCRDVLLALLGRAATWQKKPHAACKRMEPFKQVDCWITRTAGKASERASRGLRLRVS